MPTRQATPTSSTQSRRRGGRVLQPPPKCKTRCLPPWSGRGACRSVSAGPGGPEAGDHLLATAYERVWSGTGVLSNLHDPFLLEAICASQTWTRRPCVPGTCPVRARPIRQWQVVHGRPSQSDAGVPHSAAVPRRRAGLGCGSNRKPPLIPGRVWPRWPRFPARSRPPPLSQSELSQARAQITPNVPTADLQLTWLSVS